MDTDKVLISSRMLSFTNNSTVPTAEQVLVPETLLKKRKSNEKAAAEAAAKKVELKKVNVLNSFYVDEPSCWCDDTEQPIE
jgi:hypothetical protein